MNRLRYSTVVALGLWIAVAPARAEAQEAEAHTLSQPEETSRSLHGASATPRPLLLSLPRGSQLVQLRPTWARTAQSNRNARPQRGVGRKILGAAVGATGGFFAGGYLGSAIEGNRCHCDDPGLKGVVIGAPIGAAAGGILGGLYLF